MNIKFKDISHIFLALSISLLCINTLITINHAKKIECLNNKLDSLTINNNYSYSYIKTIKNKNP